MGAVDTVRDLLHSEPFQSFRILTSGGESFVVRNPDLAVMMKSQVFIAQPNSDRSTYIPFLHIAMVETLGNGPVTRPRRQRRR